jgi:hypothetical protein
MGWSPSAYHEKIRILLGIQKSEVSWLTQGDETSRHYIHRCSLTIGLECFQSESRIFRTFEGRHDRLIVKFPKGLKLDLSCAPACFPLQEALEARQGRPGEKTN